MRVVIDTNIWISFLIGQSLAGLSDAIIADRVEILFNEELFAELITVLQRPKFKKYFSGTVIEDFMVSRLFFMAHSRIASPRRSG
jgi:putative PIN family toxin of toxin-antitoxin system